MYCTWAWVVFLRFVVDAISRCDETVGGADEGTVTFDSIFITRQGVCLLVLWLLERVSDFIRARRRIVVQSLYNYNKKQLSARGNFFSDIMVDFKAKLRFTHHSATIPVSQVSLFSPVLAINYRGHPFFPTHNVWRGFRWTWAMGIFNFTV